jgi:hypothetical protein
MHPLAIAVREVALLVASIAMAEIWNLFWHVVCATKFRAFPCAVDFSMPPTNVIEMSIICIIVEALFLATAMMGATVCPNDYGGLTMAWGNGRPEEWERELQVHVLARYAFAVIPGALLEGF